MTLSYEFSTPSGLHMHASDVYYDTGLNTEALMDASRGGGVFKWNGLIRVEILGNTIGGEGCFMKGAEY